MFNRPPFSILVIICFTYGLTTFTLCAQQRMGAYILPEKALEEFAPTIYRKEDSKSISQWTRKWKAERVTEGMRAKGERYVVYHVKVTTYWFGPFSDHVKQEHALKRLLDLRNQIPENSKKYIYIYPILLELGKPISVKDFPTLSSGVPIHILSPEESKKLDKELNRQIKKAEQFKLPKIPKDIGEIGDLKKIEKAMTKAALDGNAAKKIEKLKGEHGNSEKGNGLEGPFPVSYSFSKWFAMMIDIFTDILDCAFFGCEMKDKVEKILTLAYMIMPDVMDRIASSLAKLQDKITPNELDNALNHIADVTQYAYNFYQDFKKLRRLVQDPDFQELLGELDLSEAVKHLNRYGLKINLNCDFIPCNCIKSIAINTNSEESCLKEIKEKAKKKIKKEVFKQANKYLHKSGIPVLKNLNIGAFEELLEDKDWEKFAKAQAKSIVCPILPSDYRGDCEDFIRGDYENAILQSAGRSIQKHTGLSSSNVQCMMRHLKDENYRQALICAKNIPEKYYPKYFKKYASSLDELIAQSDEEGMKRALENFVNTAIDNKVIKSAISTGAFLMEKILKDENIKFEEIVPTIAEAVQAKTGINAAHVTNTLRAIKQENYIKALEQAAEGALDKYGNYFGQYQASVRNFIRNKDWQSAKKALNVFLERTIDNNMLKKALGMGLYLAEKVKQGEKINLEELMREKLKELGYDFDTIEKIIKGKYKIDKEKMMIDFAEALKITDQRVLSALKELDFDKAIDLQLEFLRKQDFKAGEQANYIKQRLKNKKEMLTVLGKVLKKQISDKDYRLRVIYERKLQ